MDGGWQVKSSSVQCAVEEWSSCHPLGPSSRDWSLTKRAGSAAKLAVRNSLQVPQRKWHKRPRRREGSQGVKSVAACLRQRQGSGQAHKVPGRGGEVAWQVTVSLRR